MMAVMMERLKGEEIGGESLEKIAGRMVIGVWNFLGAVFED
jgi:hypothetical protein